MFGYYLGYIAPELKEKYFKLDFFNGWGINKYKSGLFSLGLVTLHMSTLN
jgi:hypothetical protein